MTPLLIKALSQNPVKLKKQKPMFTKAEIEQMLKLIKYDKEYFYHISKDNQYYKTQNSLIKKLNEHLKELI